VSPRELALAFHLQAAAAEAQDALGDQVPGRGVCGGQLIDLACEAHDYDNFRSGDPVAAAGFVVSTWRRCCGHHGNAMGSRRSPKQRRHRWFGGVATAGPVAARGASGASLAVVLARMLRVADTWEGFAGSTCGRWTKCRSAAHRRADYDVPLPGPSTTSALAEWHGFLLEAWWTPRRSARQDRRSTLGGPEQTFLSHGSRTDAETPSPAT
jgi:hypothetical protein